MNVRKVKFKAARLSKKITLLPYIIIYANQNNIGWRDWAFDMGWLCWYVGFCVKEEHELYCKNCGAEYPDECNCYDDEYED